MVKISFYFVFWIFKIMLCYNFSKKQVNILGLRYLKKKISSIKSLTLNFGPQHPAAHGVLRLILNLKNEIILNCDANIGLLHRGSEKLIENKIFVNAMPYFDRMDYVSTILQERAFSLNLENITKKTIKNNFILKSRVVFDELTRILNHYLAIACHALDVGSMSSIFWAFEDREKIMEFFEYYSGARMHTALHKPFYLEKVISAQLSEQIMQYVLESRVTLNEVNATLSLNKIWKLRLKNNGKLSLTLVDSCSVTGVLSRCVGLKRDLRLLKYGSYHNYFFLNFQSYFSRNGDSYDRFLLRLSEINESLFIISQGLYCFFSDSSKNKLRHYLLKKIFNKFNLMERVIDHFKYWSSGMFTNSGVFYAAVESGKGEFGTTLILNGGNTAFRCKVRSPSYYNLLLLTFLCKFSSLSDLITLIGTVDVVFGEVDR